MLLFALVYRFGEGAHLQIPVGSGNMQQLARVLDARKEFAQIGVRALVLVVQPGSGEIVHWDIPKSPLQNEGKHPFIL